MSPLRTLMGKCEESTCPCTTPPRVSANKSPGAAWARWLLSDHMTLIWADPSTPVFPHVLTFLLSTPLQIKARHCRLPDMVQDSGGKGTSGPCWMLCSEGKVAWARIPTPSVRAHLMKHKRAAREQLGFLPFFFFLNLSSKSHLHWPHSEESTAPTYE